MIEKLETLAANLIPHRKWMLIAFLVSFIGAMPAAIGLMVLFNNPAFFFLALFVSILGFAWSWGLFLISFWYDPDGGPLTREKILKTTHPIFRWHAYVMRFIAPAFLVILFLSPFIALAMQVPFMQILMER